LKLVSSPMADEIPLVPMGEIHDNKD